MLQYIKYEMKTSLLLLLSLVIGSPEVFSEETLHRKYILNLWNTAQLSFMRKELFLKSAHCQPISELKFDNKFSDLHTSIKFTCMFK